MRCELGQCGARLLHLGVEEEPTPRPVVASAEDPVVEVQKASH